MVLVDGDCALCSAYAQFVSARDARQYVYFETQVSAVVFCARVETDGSRLNTPDTREAVRRGQPACARLYPASPRADQTDLRAARRMDPFSGMQWVVCAHLRR